MGHTGGCGLVGLTRHVSDRQSYHLSNQYPRHSSAASINHGYLDHSYTFYTLYLLSNKKLSPLKSISRTLPSNPHPFPCNVPHLHVGVAGVKTLSRLVPTWPAGSLLLRLLPAGPRGYQETPYSHGGGERGGRERERESSLLTIKK